MPTRRLFLGSAIAAVQAAKTRLVKDDLATPALLVDLDALEANIAKMAAHVKASGRALRPHAKTHKCPEIARMLIRAGAVGACCAKLSEAETFAAAGIGGLLVTSAVIGKSKIERAVRLAAKRPETIFVADNAQNVRDLNDAAASRKLKLNLAIDLCIGRRTGILPGPAAIALGEVIASQPHLRFAGLQAYAGHASHTRGFENRVRVSREAMAQAVETATLLKAKGIACPLVSGGSTGTYNIDTEIDGVTELQPGSFIFMDVDYNRIGGKDGTVYRDFRNSLYVLTTVISRPSDEWAIVDAGFKAFSTDRPFPPEPRDGSRLKYAFAGDEHGQISGAPVKIGDRLEFIVPHCDPTVNLYDHIYALRGDAVEAVWRVAARGKSQ